MSEVNYTEQNPWVLPSGRKLWRHSNGEGCVIEFDMYGKIVQLYVPDAQYRNFSSRAISNDTGWKPQLHIPVLKNNSSNSYDYLLEVTKAYDQPFSVSEILTDIQLQTKLDLLLDNGTFADDFTAKDGTDAILTSLGNNSEVASYVRSLIPSELNPCDIPNIYELCVIWLESDNIDAIDPTIPSVNSFEDFRIGSPNRFSQNSFWTCTEVARGSTYYGVPLTASGGVTQSYRYNNNLVLPVLELSIKDAPKTKLITKVVVVDKGEAYETKGIPLSETNILTTLTSLVQEYQNTYNELNQKVTALETKYNQGKVKIVESMMELKNNPEENMLYINDEVKAIVDDGSGIIPKAYISDGSEVTLKEIERKEEDPDDGNEYLGYVNTSPIKVSVILQDSNGNRLTGGGINWAFYSNGSISSDWIRGGTTNENGECSFIINPPADTRDKSLYLAVKPAPAGHNPINPFLITEEQLKSTITITSSTGTLLPGTGA